jgi:hypothetical protein
MLKNKFFCRDFAHIEALKSNLLEMEKTIGHPLRENIRDLYHICPLHQFAPELDSRGNVFEGVAYSAWYTSPSGKSIKYCLPENKPGNRWWYNLSYSERQEIMNYISSWIVEMHKPRVPWYKKLFRIRGN